MSIATHNPILAYDRHACFKATNAYLSKLTPDKQGTHWSSNQATDQQKYFQEFHWGISLWHRAAVARLQSLFVQLAEGEKQGCATTPVKNGHTALPVFG